MNSVGHQQVLPNITDDTAVHPVSDQTPTSPATPSSHIPTHHHVHRSHPSSTGSMLPKTVSSSMADLSLSSHSHKMTTASTRPSTFQSKLDNCSLESYKKIPLSQSFDWGMLAVTNTDLILLYNKDKTSLVIFDASGHENEVSDNGIFSFSQKILLFSF